MKFQKKKVVLFKKNTNKTKKHCFISPTKKNVFFYNTNARFHQLELTFNLGSIVIRELKSRIKFNFRFTSSC